MYLSSKEDWPLSVRISSKHFYRYQTLCWICIRPFLFSPPPTSLDLPVFKNLNSNFAIKLAKYLLFLSHSYSYKFLTGTRHCTRNLECATQFHRSILAALIYKIDKSSSYICYTLLPIYSRHSCTGPMSIKATMQSRNATCCYTSRFNK